jgi:TatD DNase family protein
MIDSHCHLADETFAGDLTDVVVRAKDAGLTSVLCILSADEPDEIARVGVVRSAWPEVQFSAGVHPHRAGGFKERPADAAAATNAAINRVGAVAVGEIGLDYHYDFAPRAVQQAVFEAQVALAISCGLPVVIHTREAIDDTMAVLEHSPGVSGVMHCFTGTLDEARRALDIGFHISLSGIVTFPRAESLREVARFVPEDRLLVETDAPFLAPVPHRGRRNEPAWVVETLKSIATARGVAATDLAATVVRNFLALVPARSLR